MFRQVPLHGECHIINHLQKGSSLTVISLSLFSDANHHPPYTSPGKSNYPLFQEPRNLGSSSGHQLWAPLLLDIFPSYAFSISSFRQTLHRTISCTSRPSQLHILASMVSLLLPFQKTLGSQKNWSSPSREICIYSLRASRLLSSHRKVCYTHSPNNIFLFSVCKRERNHANNSTHNKNLFPVTLSIGGFGSGSHNF